MAAAGTVVVGDPTKCLKCKNAFAVGEKLTQAECLGSVEVHRSRFCDVWVVACISLDNCVLLLFYGPLDCSPRTAYRTAWIGCVKSCVCPALLGAFTSTTLKRWIRDSAKIPRSVGGGHPRRTGTKQRYGSARQASSNFNNADSSPACYVWSVEEKLFEYRKATCCTCQKHQRVSQSHHLTWTF